MRGRGGSDPFLWHLKEAERKEKEEEVGVNRNEILVLGITTCYFWVRGLGGEWPASETLRETKREEKKRKTEQEVHFGALTFVPFGCKAWEGSGPLLWHLRGTQRGEKKRKGRVKRNRRCI